MHMYGIEKDGTDESIYSNGDADIENRLLDTVGEKEGGMICESNIETYILPYGK